MMGSPAAPSGPAGLQTLEEPSGEPGRPATGVACEGGGEPRVSGPRLSLGALPKGLLGGAADRGAMDGEGALVLESRSYTSTELVEEAELAELGNGAEAAEARGGEGREKIRNNGASGGGGGHVPEKEGDGGGGGELAAAGLAENPFLVGDFVWGKIKSHPWWPGQVYDSSDASEYAQKVRRRDQQCVLVAYFGDRTFAWCDPSQLRPFTQGFEQMSRQSMTKNFVGALKEALDEVQRRLESEIACSCFQEAVLAGLSDRRVVNAGIKAGATVPKGHVKELSVADHVPAEFLGRVHEIACDVSTVGLLEIIRIKGWLSALNRWMGWRAGLPAEHQVEEVVSLVDVKVNAGPSMEPAEKGVMSTRTSSVGGKRRRGISEDKPLHRKKVRSMAELIAETDMDVDTDTAEDGIAKEKELATAQKPAAATPRHRKKKGEEAKSADDSGYQEGEGTGSGRRERKRSKYLSPPYTTLTGHHSVSPKEEAHPKKDMVAAQATGSEADGGMPCPLPTILKCNTEAIRDKSAAMLERGGASADEMLSEFLSAALSPMYLKGNRSSSIVKTFFDRFRSYSYANVSEYGKSLETQTDGDTVEFKTEKDGKSSKPPAGKPGGFAESRTPDRSSSASGRKPSAQKRKKPLGCDANDTKAAKFRGKRKSVGQEAGVPEPGQPRLKKNKDGVVSGDGTGAALLLTFATGVPLPSKEQLISAFSKFGALRESETELLRDSGCARVVFAKSSDAEKAFKSSDEDGALGPDVASSRLQYLSDNLSVTPLPPPGQKPPLQFVKKSLESMISALREPSPPEQVAASSDDLKPEARENLVDEMNGLLKKVSKMLSGPAAGAT